MPLVVLCGNPCSGKSSICRKIENECKNRGEQIDVLNDQILKLDRNEDYRGKWVQRLHLSLQDASNASSAVLGFIDREFRKLVD